MREPTFDRRLLERAGHIIDQAVDSGAHPSAVAAVVTAAGAVWRHAAPGISSATFDSIYLLASITKPVMATAVMQMVEQGALSLNAPVSKHLPEFAGSGRELITPRHLLTHSSGLSEFKWQIGRFGPNDVLGTCFEEACAAPLQFEPGIRCQYCTLSFAVLAELVTRLSGKPYPIYVADHVLAPLQMEHTSFHPTQADRMLPVIDFPGCSDTLFARAIAGGGLWSTLDDIVRFARAFLGNGALDGSRVLAPPTVEVMTRNHTSGMVQEIDGIRTPFNYGYGWGKPGGADDILCSPAAFGHGGATGTLLWIDPHWGFAFAFLTNRWGADGDVPNRALNAVYGSIGSEE